jgi:ABC-2 type transport system permease protein
MDGVILIETLRRKWKHIIYWGGGLALYAIFTFMLIPDMEALQKYVEILESMGSGMLSVIGLSDASAMATPAGYVGVEFFSFLLLITSVYGVIAGLDVTANDEDKGVMDMMLSLPMERWRVVIEKMLAYSLIILGIGLVTFVGTVIGREVSNQPLDMSLSSLLQSSLNFVPGTIVVMSATVLISTLVRRRSLAMALSGVFVVASFLLNVVAEAAGSKAADAVAQISIFQHYGGATVLRDGIAYGSAFALLLVAVILAVGAAAKFIRRDVAV